MNAQRNLNGPLIKHKTLPSFQELDLSFNEDLDSLVGIKALTELTSLNIDGCAVRLFGCLSVILHFVFRSVYLTVCAFVCFLLFVCLLHLQPMSDEKTEVAFVFSGFSIM